MDKNTLPFKWFFWAVFVFLMIFFLRHWPWKQDLLPMVSSIPSSSQNNTTVSDHPANIPLTVNPINPVRTDAEILHCIAQQNENREKVTALLEAHALLTAEIRQKTEASKFKTITSQDIPGPDTTPAPADLLEKLKSNQLIHH